MFIVANAVLNIILTILISLNSIDIGIQQILISAIRFFCGIASNVYSVAVVLGIMNFNCLSNEGWIFWLAGLQNFKIK